MREGPRAPSNDSSSEPDADFARQGQQMRPWREARHTKVPMANVGYQGDMWEVGERALGLGPTSPLSRGDLPPD